MYQSAELQSHLQSELKAQKTNASIHFSYSFAQPTRKNSGCGYHINNYIMGFAKSINKVANAMSHLWRPFWWLQSSQVSWSLFLQEESCRAGGRTTEVKGHSQSSKSNVKCEPDPTTQSILKLLSAMLEFSENMFTQFLRMQRKGCGVFLMLKKTC